MTESTGNDDIDFNEIKNKCKIPIKETENISGVKTQNNSLSIQNTIENLDYFSEILINNKSNCLINDMIEKKCSLPINNNITEIYNLLKEQIKSNKSLIFSTEKVTFQISTLEEQKSNNQNISSIDLGKCEQKIKDERGLSENDNLIIYKIDIKSEDLSSTYVQYEIYDPKTYDYINLDICEGIFINIYSPVTLKDNTEALFQSMSNSGYNLFNLNDSFYNDICSTYTTQDGTDLTLLDRKNIIYDKNGNISMCQEGCQLINYNSTLKKANCDCKVQTEDTNTDIETINFNRKDIAESFYKTLTNSNFLVLKCFKLVFSKKGQFNNIGSYVMSVMTFLFIILLFFFIFKGNEKINNYIRLLLNQKEIIQESQNKIKKSNNKKEKKPSKNKSSNKKIAKTKNFPPKKSKKKVEIQNLLASTNKNLDEHNTKMNQINLILNNPKGKNKNDNNKNKKKVKFGNKYTDIIKQTVKDDDNNNECKLNDEELNELEYEIAIELDI